MLNATGYDWDIQEGTGVVQVQHSDLATGYAETPDANMILNLVLHDWFVNTNKGQRQTALGYVNYKNTTNEVGELKALSSVRYNGKSFPKNYVPNIGKNPLFPKKWVQGTIDMLNEGEIWIEMRKFKKQGDGKIKIVFIYTGWSFVGGAEVTYSAWQKNGKWLVECEGANDP